MSDPDPQRENLTDQFRQLGQNLGGVLRAAWDSPERQRFQRDVASGLAELNRTLNEEAQHLADSPTAVRLRAEVEDVAQRVRSGQVESRARQEVVDLLRALNTGLNNVIERLSEDERRATEAAPDRSDAPDANVPGDAAAPAYHPDIPPDAEAPHE